MNKTIRIFLAFAVFAAIVAIGLNGTAWASKLNVGVQAPAASAADQGLPAGARPAGTVPVIHPLIPITGGQLITVGSCATAFVTTAPAGIVYTVSVVPADALPQVLPGKLISCAIKIEAQPGPDMGAVIQVCFPIPPTTSGITYYYGPQWFKTTMPVSDGQSCVMVPAVTGSPAYSGLFGG